MNATQDELVLGRITSAFGVQGWVKVYSYTDPMENVLDYRKWTLRLKDGTRREVVLEKGRRQGPGLVARLRGVSDREQALALANAEIVIPASSLPELEPGEYYWHQLEGLRVETADGLRLGYVDHLFETGSNDVLVVKGDADSYDQRQRLIPYLPEQVIQQIDLEGGRLVVDWDPEF